ncbi:MAG: histidine phosphatase family protein [Candidatus Nealsonbacteria bacterium]|nr:histidine phosphatase family protein [Candidatus Nealsonbacteria bacterium]
MAKLFLLRHLKSQWNLEDRFAGWVDNPLSQEGRENAKNAALKLKGEEFDIAYTSPLIRNEETVLLVLRNLGDKYPLFMHLRGKMKDWGNFKGTGNYVPVYVSVELNERYYGDLQGMRREEAKSEFGEEQFNKWRRGFEFRPPRGESLKDTYKRTVPFFKKNIEKNLKSGNNVLIIGSHNALRSIAKYIEKISDKDIINFEIPYGGLVKYELDDSLNLKNKKVVA